MKWLEISVRAPAEFVEPLSHIFYTYGHGGVALEEPGGFNPDEGEVPPEAEWVTIKTYLPVNSTTVERRSRIDIGVRLVAHLSPISPLQEHELEEGWADAWKRHFSVLHVGDRIVVCPTWQTYQPAESEVVVSLDPGMAFGTGHHPTTRRCLELLEQIVVPGMDVLDVGCGSGILSIAASKLGARGVTALEIDAVAAQAAVTNVAENEVSSMVRALEGTLPHAEVPSKFYDVVVANISAKVISELAADLVKAARPSGRLIVSGILTENRTGVEDALIHAGAGVDERIADGDWVTLVVSLP